MKYWINVMSFAEIQYWQIMGRLQVTDWDRESCTKINCSGNDITSIIMFTNQLCNVWIVLVNLIIAANVFLPPLSPLWYTMYPHCCDFSHVLTAGGVWLCQCNHVEIVCILTESGDFTDRAVCLSPVVPGRLCHGRGGHPLSTGLSVSLFTGQIPQAWYYLSGSSRLHNRHYGICLQQQGDTNLHIGTFKSLPPIIRHKLMKIYNI